MVPSRGGEPAKTPVGEDAISALKNLRFADDEARPTVREILQAAPDLALDELIVRALARLGDKKTYLLDSVVRESGPEYGSCWTATPTWEIREEMTGA